MTPHPKTPDELLSACHDGELTSDERAEVERLLSDDPALRETLDDYRELTSVLQSLPRTQAPLRLREDVLRRIQSSAGKPARGAAKRRPWLWGISLAATAAMLLILFRVGRSPEAPSLARHDRAPTKAAMQNENVASARATAPDTQFEMASESVPAVAVAKAAPMAAPVGDQPLPTAAAPGASFGMAPARGAEGALKEGVAPSSADASAGLSALSPDTLASRLRIDHAAPPAVSDVLAHVYESGDQTLIVEFDVVNVDQTSRDMLVLLRQRGVSLVTAAADEVDPSAGSSHKSPSRDGSPQLVAVYVEATETQLATMVDDFITRMPIADGAAYNTSFVGQELGRQFQRMEDLYGTGVDRAELAASPMVRTESAADEASPKSSSNASPASAAEGMTAAAEQTPQLLGVRFALPPEAYQELETRHRQLSKESRRSVAPTGPAQEEAAAAQPWAFSGAPRNQPAPESQASSRDNRRQMLIVLRAPMSK